MFKVWKKPQTILIQEFENLNGKKMIFSKCAICGSQKSSFIKKQEGNGILSNLGLKMLLNKIPLLDDILF